MTETQLASVCGFKRPNAASADASLHQQVTVVTVNPSRARGVLQRRLPVGLGYCEHHKKQNRSTARRTSTKRTKMAPFTLLKFLCPSCCCSGKSDLWPRGAGEQLILARVESCACKGCLVSPMFRSAFFTATVLSSFFPAVCPLGGLTSVPECCQAPRHAEMWCLIKILLCLPQKQHQIRGIYCNVTLFFNKKVY